MRQLLFHDDPQFWFETVRVFGHAAYGGSDFGEVLATASRIRSGDYDAWHDAWLATADRLAAEADRAQTGGHPISARDARLRACTYYRTAEFFLHDDPDDPRIAHAHDRAVACFQTAAPHFDTPAEPIQIPYDDTTLHGYFYPAPGTDPRPTLVMHNGFDGSAEELHFMGAAAGSERGYHVLTFDGPGQPSAIRRGLTFRPDWENVVGPVLDHATALPGVDPDRIALLGVSLGGMLAPRAAAFDSRVAGLVAVDGVYDAGTAITAMLPFTSQEVRRRALAEHDPDFDAALDQMMRASPTLRWACAHGSYVMDADSPRAFLAKYLDYHLRDGVAERITCPTLICAAENDLYFNGRDQPPEPQRLHQHLTAPKTLLTFTEVEGADAHCHLGAQRLATARIYDWLDNALVGPSW